MAVEPWLEVSPLDEFVAAIEGICERPLRRWRAQRPALRRARAQVRELAARFEVVLDAAGFAPELSAVSVGSEELRISLGARDGRVVHSVVCFGAAVDPERAVARWKGNMLTVTVAKLNWQEAE
jgi:HSP20 family molecular chaperone IbpA